MAFGSQGSPAERPDRTNDGSFESGKASGPQAERSEPPEVVAAVRRLQERRDPSGFEPIYLHYYESLRIYFLKRGSSEADAEDLAQEVLTRVWDNLDQYTGEGPFSAWVARIAANQWKNAVRERRAKKRQATEVELSEAVQGSKARPLFTDSPPPAETALAKSQTRERLRDALGELPEGMRACLTLRVGRDFTYREIADTLGVKMGTVQSQIHDGKKRLRDRLGPVVDELDI